MKRIALLAAVVFPVVVLFYAFHGTSKANTAPQPNKRDEAPVAVSAGPAPSLATATPNEHATNVEGLPDALEAGYLAVENSAKTCYQGRPAPKPIRPNGPDETIETIKLSYRQVSQSGIAHIEDLKVTEGALSDKTLQDCIVRTASSATWSSTAPDGEIGALAQNVNLGDLLRPDYGLPPPSKRSPMPTAPPPPEKAAPLGTRTKDNDDDGANAEHQGVLVPDPSLAHQPK